jgi:hypothetical protein
LGGNIEHEPLMDTAGACILSPAAVKERRGAHSRQREAQPRARTIRIDFGGWRQLGPAKIPTWSSSPNYSTDDPGPHRHGNHDGAPQPLGACTAAHARDIQKLWRTGHSARIWPPSASNPPMR